MTFSLKYATCADVVPECNPTNDGPGVSLYFNTFPANSLKCYDIINLIIVLFTNNQFQKVANYALNEQLNNMGKKKNRKNETDILVTVSVYITCGNNTNDKNDKSARIDILDTSKASIKNINSNGRRNIKQGYVSIRKYNSDKHSNRNNDISFNYISSVTLNTNKNMNNYTDYRAASLSNSLKMTDGGVLCCSDTPEIADTDAPTQIPSANPSNNPTQSPSDDPSGMPSTMSSKAPSGEPTSIPTASPTANDWIVSWDSTFEDNGEKNWTATMELT